MWILEMLITEFLRKKVKSIGAERRENKLQSGSDII